MSTRRKLQRKRLPPRRQLPPRHHLPSSESSSASSSLRSSRSSPTRRTSSDDANECSHSSLRRSSSSSAKKSDSESPLVFVAAYGKTLPCLYANSSLDDRCLLSTGFSACFRVVPVPGYVPLSGEDLSRLEQIRAEISSKMKQEGEDDQQEQLMLPPDDPRAHNSSVEDEETTLAMREFITSVSQRPRRVVAVGQYSSVNSAVRLFDVTDVDISAELCTIAGHRGIIRGLTSVPPSSTLMDPIPRIVSGDQSKTLYVSKADSGKTLARIPLRTHNVWRLACVPEWDRLVLAGGEDGSLGLYDLEIGAASQSYEGDDLQSRFKHLRRSHRSGIARDVAADLDHNAVFATMGHYVVHWDRRMDIFHSDFLTRSYSDAVALCYASNLMRLIIANEDGSVRMLDLRNPKFVNAVSGRYQRPDYSHRSETLRISESPAYDVVQVGRTRFVSVAANRDLTLWDLKKKKAAGRTGDGYVIRKKRMPDSCFGACVLGPQEELSPEVVALRMTFVLDFREPLVWVSGLFRMYRSLLLVV